MSTLVSPLTVSALEEWAVSRASEEMWRDDTGSRTWGDFGGLLTEARTKCHRAGLAPGEVVITPGEMRLESLAWLVAVAAREAVAAPLRAERLGELATWEKTVELDWRVQDGALVRMDAGRMGSAAQQLLGTLRVRRHPGLILATGGTTGAPKLVLHDLAALLAGIMPKFGSPRRTLPLMHFDHIGGFDMVWRGLARGQVLVAPPDMLTPAAVAVTLARHRVEIMPATPSFLNLLLLSGAVSAQDLSALRVVPYGAEPMPAGLLSRLKSALPEVDFVQRFGTSETGALPVQETPAGLLLPGGTDGYAWQIRDGELWIQSPTRALGYLAGDNGSMDEAGWFHTGDLALQQPDGSVLVLGRRAELINVGGEKVRPTEVEAVLLSHPLVADCRVGAAPSALLGQVVTAEIVWTGTERDALAVKRLLHEFAASRLARHQLPAAVRLVASIATTQNLKKQRMLSP